MTIPHEHDGRECSAGGCDHADLIASPLDVVDGLCFCGEHTEVLREFAVQMDRLRGYPTDKQLKGIRHVHIDRPRTRLRPLGN